MVDLVSVIMPIVVMMAFAEVALRRPMLVILESSGQAWRESQWRSAFGHLNL